MKPHTNRKHLVLVPGLAAIALAAFANIAAAQVTSEQQSAIRSNCRSDFTSKCSGVKPGGKEALECLQKNVNSLGAACKKAVSATIPAPAPAPAAAAAKPAPAPTRAPAAAAAPAPAPAAAAPAAAPAAPPKIVSAPPPKPKVATPVRPAAAKPAAKPASPPPQQAAVAPAATAADAAPPPTPEQLKAIKFTCRRNLSALCRGLPDGAESVACLQRNAGKLAPDCKTSLAAIADTAPLAPAAPGTPPATRTPNAPIAMTAVIGRACLRDLALHCRNTGIGDGQKIACLMARGSKLSVLCKGALKITEPVR